jgi:hypothetical protein
MNKPSNTAAPSTVDKYIVQNGSVQLNLILPRFSRTQPDA